MMQKILIIGGCGFIGKHLIKNFKFDKDFEIYVADIVTPNKVENGVHYLKLDINNSLEVSKVFEEVRPCVVYHLAAKHFIPDCNSDPSSAFSTNCGGLVNILNACKAVGVNKIIFTSSAAVYDMSYLPLSESDLLVEDGVYGLTKKIGESLVRKSGLRYSILRLFNVYGPDNNTPHIIPKIIESVKDSKPLIIGDTTKVRDFIHVDDVAKILKLSIAGFGDLTFNCGTGVGTSVKELIDMARKISGSNTEVIESESFKRNLDYNRIVSDINLLKSKHPVEFIDIESGLRKLIMD